MLHWRHDQRIPVEMGRDMARGIPGAEVVPLESRNHVLVDDEPAWQVCLQTVADFLAEHRI